MTADGLFWMMLFAAWCLYLAVSAAIMESLIPWIKKKRPARLAPQQSGIENYCNYKVTRKAGEVKCRKTEC
ncbi:hypothetical protein [Anaerotruncus rubiinfantis]|uniref:hypothetical protein n=1 Tax=Anaerotruncus rubiinfantis TaxID=1720200 RepID=UPI00082DEF36|nr:hypothetical protein [Anaerotruncus rubiinfantis]